jgi:hypothetical protein
MKEKSIKIIEVKSIYTYDLDIEKNELKRQACLDIRFLFEFMIFGENGNVINK